VGNSDPDFRDILNGDLSPEQEIIDLVRIFEEKDWPDNYQGICW
jgi:hypothetical protein